MEIKWNIAKWLRERKAKKREDENEDRHRRDKVYRGQALRLQGRSEEDETIRTGKLLE
jgi:hypothetical protein